jgi:aminopeptidase N
MNHRFSQAGQEFAGPGSRFHYPPDLRIEPKHIALEASFDIEARQMRALATTTVVARSGGARTLLLHAVAFEELTVVDADGRPLAHDYDGSELKVTWEEPFGPGETRRVAVGYRVQAPVSGLVFSVPDDLYPDRCRYVATDNETERARYWLPCIDLPSVRTTFDLRITAPEELTILAAGTEQECVGHGDGRATAHWVLDYPCPSYLICIAVGDFCRFDDESVEGVPIAYFGPRKGYSPEDLRRSFGRTPEMMRWLTKQVGAPFPFSKYYQFALPGIWGAMENISLVSWSGSAIHDEVRSREARWHVDATNIHEMAHAYFGDAVVIRDHSHSWLKESWATYIETVWLEQNEGADDARYDLWINANRYFSEADSKYVRPIATRKYRYSWQMFDAHTYPGGACRIHMLRHILGDDLFWPAVRDYVATYSKGVVETSDFRRVLEKHSGRSLQRFFDEWIHSPGYLQLEVSFSFDRERHEGIFKLAQTQVDEEHGIGLFTVDLDLWWEDADGSEHLVTTTLDQHRKSVVTAMRERPLQVRVDPQGKLLKKLTFDPGARLLRRQLTAARDIEGRILAAQVLAENGSPRNIEALREAFQSEEFYGVRVAMAKALGGANSTAALEALAEWLDREQDPRVIPALAGAIAGYRDQRSAAALRRFLQRPERGYGERGRVLEALAQMRLQEDLPRIEQELDAPDWYGVLRGAALRALGRTKFPGATELLAQRVAYGAESDTCRPIAVAALAASIEWLGDAARALGRLKATEAIPQIERIKSGVALQDHATIDAIIDGLRDAARQKAPAVAAKEIKELREMVRKLSERLEKVEGRLLPEEEEK